MRMGIFGGTFNPIHLGHLRAAEETREILSLDKVLFIPSGNPPLKNEGIADAAHRYEMTRQAVTGNPFFDASDMEAVQPGKSYTVDTIEKLKAIYPGADLFFLLGIDAFLDIPNWWRPETLISLVNFAVLSRPGRSFADLLRSPYLSVTQDGLRRMDEGLTSSWPCPLKTGKTAVLVSVTPMDISSSDIRKRMAEGTSIKYLLPRDVEFFIISNKLYNKQESRYEEGRRQSNQA